MAQEQPLPARCSACGMLVGEESIDIMASRTVYDENREPIKTMEELGWECADYIVIGKCCADKALLAWYKLVQQLVQE